MSRQQASSHVATVDGVAALSRRLVSIARLLPLRR
jgi:hypothetical protein